MTMTRCLLTVAFVATPHLAHAQPAPPVVEMPHGGVSVPIVALTPLPIIEVRVNGRGPFRFAIDTGARGHARADVSLVKALGLEGQGSATAGDGAGRTAQMAVVTLDSINVGGAIFRNVTALSRDYNVNRPASEHIQGILAFDLFTDYLLTLDFPARRLSIATGSLPDSDGRTVVAYETFRNTMAVPVTVGTRTFQAHLDTGSAGGFTLPLSAAETLPLTSPIATTGRAQLVASQVTISQATTSAPVLFAGWPVRVSALEFWDLYEHANVGSPVLAQFAITIDQRQQRLRLIPASDPIVVQLPRRVGMTGQHGEDGYRISTVSAGGAGARAGLQPGDLIVKIAGRAVADISRDQFAAVLTGAPTVVLTVVRGDKTLEITVVF